MRIYFAIVTLAIMAACSKTKVAYDGTVYSKHGYPLPGAKVVVTYKKGDRKKSLAQLSTFTNAQGKFVLHAKLSRNALMETIAVASDSGSYESGLSNRKGISDMKIEVQ